MKLGALAFATIASATIATASCGVQTACDCVDGSIVVHIPVDQAAPTNTIVLGGGACSGVTPTCIQTSAGSCLEYTLYPAAPGECQIDVMLATHQFSSKVNVKRGTGCCSGLYPDPIGAGDVQVSSAVWHLKGE